MQGDHWSGKSQGNLKYRQGTFEIQESVGNVRESGQNYKKVSSKNFANAVLVNTILQVYFISLVFHLSLL